MDTPTTHLKHAILELEALDFFSAERSLAQAQDHLSACQGSLTDEDNDEVHNHVFLLREYIALHADYIGYWNQIAKGGFAKSWSVLQDVQDHLRLLFRFLPCGSRPASLRHIEKQCAHLEQLYPFDVFASVGGVTSLLECSICHKPMNSFDCNHIAGELYRGRLAQGIAKTFSVHEISLTPNPRDKRCVLQFADSAPQFSHVKYLASLLTSHTLSPLRFDGLRFANVPIPKHVLAATSRNDSCPCGSGHKYKKCCIDMKIPTRRHADILVGSMTVDVFVSFSHLAKP